MITIIHLNRFHARSLRKDSQLSDISLDNIFSKIVLGLWVSLIEIEFNILMHEHSAHTSKFYTKKVSKMKIIEKWIVMLDYYFSEHYLSGNHKRILSIENLGHSAYCRHATLKDIIEIDLALFCELRNRVSHGQWEVAFNSDLTKKNDELTSSVWTLTKKEIMILKSLCKNLPPIFALLITSKKTFERDYDKYINRIIKAKRDADLKYKKARGNL